ncbi:hypothetical protein [Actinoplanes subtropicus]|uniref:hypothetical protein n=1 Tax=Actinoplanes subtropicus TaxID=543632 RepID=UPI0004C3B3F8|nr:hypothetical protein [Actinoplanes subtropicus]
MTLTSTSRAITVGVDSEIGALCEAIAHRPGRELDRLTPGAIADLLFDDVLPAGHVTVHLAFIDVRGLRALARTAIRSRRGGGCLRLRGVGTRTRRILYLLGWAKPFELTPDGPVPRSSGCQRRPG